MLAYRGIKGKRDAIIYVERQPWNFIWNHNTLCSHFFSFGLLLLSFIYDDLYIFSVRIFQWFLLFIYYCLYCWNLLLLGNLTCILYYVLLSYHMAIAYSIPSVYECNSYIPMTWSLSFSSTIAHCLPNLKFPWDNFRLSWVLMGNYYSTIETTLLSLNCQLTCCRIHIA